MPLPGGPSDKFGNRYEGRWTVLQMADVLDERAQSLRLEPPGAEGDGVEFWVRRAGAYEYHQVKRQHGTEGRWTIASLNSKRVLSRFFEKLNDPAATCTFVSSHAAYHLDELADRARRSASWQEYERDFLTSLPIESSFYELLFYCNSTAEEVYNRLRRMTIRTIDEETLQIMVEGRLAVLIEGQVPSAAAALLAQFALDQVHHELTAIDIWRYLESQGCRRREWNKDTHVLAAVEAQNNRYLGLLHDEAIRGVLFPRTEAQLAVDRLLSAQGKRSVMLSGEAGVGKSSVTPQIADRFRSLGWAMLAFRVDRMDPMQTPDHVGNSLGLPGSPAHVLAAIAQGRDCALIIDQLDAVSLASGRHPQFFECINEIIKQALTYPKMHLVLGCRKFDIDNDYRLRRLVEEGGVAEVINIQRLPHEKVREIVEDLGLDVSCLTKKQLDLLSVPLHLHLLSETASDSQAAALDFETAKDLYDKFWKRKQALVRTRLGREVRWTQVIDALCDYMSQHQALSAPEAILDEYDADAGAMVSEHVLTLDQHRYSFFHEGFFDYAFARRFAARGLRLIPLILKGEQHLFRRGQVRQILLHTREQAIETYLEDLASLLFDDRVRFHLKSATFALVSGLAEPTVEEWQIVSQPLGETSHPLYVEVWALLHGSAAWLDLVDSLGLIEAWLSNEKDTERFNRTIALLTSLQRSSPDRVAELLEPKVGLSSAWNNCFVYIMQWCEVGKSRRFFDLFLRAIDEGVLDGASGPMAINADFWDLSYDVQEQKPAWAAEVIGHYYNRCLAQALESGSTEAAGRIVSTLLNSARLGRDRQDGYFSKAARAAPLVFVDQVLPFMLQTMDLTAARAEDPPWPDGVWFYRNYGKGYDANDSLLEAMVEALSSLAVSDPKAFGSYAAHLRETQFETAQFLLIRAYAANGRRFADEAAEFLCECPARLRIGYTSNTHWAARLFIFES